MLGPQKPQKPQKRPIRIANASGFFGDRASALREMVEGSGTTIDVVTGDYLAEVTMQILAKQQDKDPSLGYAASFLAHLAPAFATALAKGVRIVVNAGGLNPASLARSVRSLAAKLGLAQDVRVATIHGDDLRGRISDLDLLHPAAGARGHDPGFVRSANAYLGAWGIARALEAGADIVICPRVTDASLVIGPAAWWHGWKRDDWSRLAGALAAGHVIECGTQATGGNYSGFRKIAASTLVYPGFPIAEIAEDGSSVITKQLGTGGSVTIGTVTAQLVYEIDSPRYLNPDVVLHMETVVLEEDVGGGGGAATDRIAIRGVQGSPPPPTTKVAVTTRGRFRNQMLFVAVGLDIDEKVALFERSMRAVLGASAASMDLEIQRIGSAKVDASRQDEASVLLRVVATSDNADDVGRAFSSTLVELALGSYPGLFIVAPPGAATEVGGYCPAKIDQALLDHVVVLPDGTTEQIAPPAITEILAPWPNADAVADADADAPPPVPTRRAPLGAVCDARSGDKGDRANVGLWVASDEAYAWLRSTITIARFRDLVPETRDLAIDRYELPNLRALNFVVHDLLRGGAAATPRFDRQAKALGEYLRSRTIDVPVALLDACG